MAMCSPSRAYRAARPKLGLANLALRALAVVLSLAAEVAYAQWFVPWTDLPDVTVVASREDPRIALVDEAIAFWNKTLEELGSGFRLGATTVVVGQIPERDLQEFGSWFVGPQGPSRPPAPASLLAVPGDMIIYLAESDLVSFASWFTPDGRRVIGIRGTMFPPMGEANVARNVIAHEIGHAIGLGHNADPRLLMCGRPAPCRPIEFRSSEPRLFPLADGEKQRLLDMYPPSWRPR